MPSDKIQLLGIVLGAAVIGAGLVLVGYAVFHNGPWVAGVILVIAGAAVFMLSMWLRGQQEPLGVIESVGYVKPEPPGVLHSMHKIK